MFKAQMKPRTVECTKKDCGNKETEQIYGLGNPGWQPLQWIQDEKGNIALLCPICVQKINDFVLTDKKEIDDKKETEDKKEK